MKYLRSTHSIFHIHSVKLFLLRLFPYTFSRVCQINHLILYCRQQLLLRNTDAVYIAYFENDFQFSEQMKEDLSAHYSKAKWLQCRENIKDTIQITHDLFIPTYIEAKVNNKTKMVKQILIPTMRSSVSSKSWRPNGNRYETWVEYSLIIASEKISGVIVAICFLLVLLNL